MSHRAAADPLRARSQMWLPVARLPEIVAALDTPWPVEGGDDADESEEDEDHESDDEDSAAAPALGQQPADKRGRP